MEYVNGLISKKMIRRWLDNYNSLLAEDKPPDALPSNSGCKPGDGITGTKLNKIMLEMALKKLPETLKRCVECRWINQKPLGQTLRIVGLPRSTYYYYCDKAIDFIYYHVNGQPARINDLLHKINNFKN